MRGTIIAAVDRSLTLTTNANDYVQLPTARSPLRDPFRSASVTTAN